MRTLPPLFPRPGTGSGTASGSAWSTIKMGGTARAAPPTGEVKVGSPQRVAVESLASLSSHCELPTPPSYRAVILMPEHDSAIWRVCVASDDPARRQRARQAALRDELAIEDQYAVLPSGWNRALARNPRLAPTAVGHRTWTRAIDQAVPYRQPVLTPHGCSPREQPRVCPSAPMPAS